MISVALCDSNLKLTFNGQLFALGIRKQYDLDFNSYYLYSAYDVPGYFKHFTSIY